MARMQQELPQRVGTYTLIGPSKEAKYPGQNWRVRCSCGAERTVPTGQWNAAYKGKAGIRCKVCKPVVSTRPSRPKTLLTYGDLTLTIQEWADRLGKPASSIYSRHSRRGDFPDEWVIFGSMTTPREMAKASTFNLDNEIERVLERLKEQMEARLYAAMQTHIQESIRLLIRPLLYNTTRQDDKPLVTVTTAEEPSTAIPPGCLPAQDPDYADYYYNPEPHPDDDVKVARDATFRKARELQGDTLAEGMLEAVKAKPEMVNTHAITLRGKQEVAEEKRIAREEKLRREKIEAAERRKLTHVDVIPEHKPFLDPDPEYGYPEFRIDKPIPESWPKQEDTTPLSQQEVDAYFATPWWQRILSNTSNRLWAYPFGFVCRTQYDRLRAYNVQWKDHRTDPTNDSAVRAEGWYDWVSDHRTLNLVMDINKAIQFLDAANQPGTQRRELNTDESIETLTNRVKSWYQQISSLPMEEYRDRLRSAVGRVWDHKQSPERVKDAGRKAYEAHQAGSL